MILSYLCLPIFSFSSGLVVYIHVRRQKHCVVEVKKC